MGNNRVPITSGCRLDASTTSLKAWSGPSVLATHQVPPVESIVTWGFPNIAIGKPTVQSVTFYATVERLDAPARRSRVERVQASARRAATLGRRLRFSVRARSMKLVGDEAVAQQHGHASRSRSSDTDTNTKSFRQPAAIRPHQRAVDAYSGPSVTARVTASKPSRARTAKRRCAPSIGAVAVRAPARRGKARSVTENDGDTGGGVRPGVTQRVVERELSSGHVLRPSAHSVTVRRSPVAHAPSPAAVAGELLDLRPARARRCSRAPATTCRRRR